MNSTDFTKLYHSRCIEDSGKHKPHFWMPQAIKPTPFTLFGSSNLSVMPEWRVEKTIGKILALNLNLELPVGDFIDAATKRDLPDLPGLKLLLKSNISDEARHYKGFEYAVEAYSVDPLDLKEAKIIAAAWNQKMEYYHPVLLATALEIKIFLVALGCLRLFGGAELARMARKISEDEFRHTKTNRSLLIELGIDGYTLPSDIEQLVSDTLYWLVCDLNLEGKAVYSDRNFIDYQFLQQASDQLMTYGYAPEFDELVFCADDAAPFEVDNAKLYDREIA